MELMNIDNNLCLYLDFHDGLNVVKVFSATHDWDRRTVIMGGVSGEEQVAELLRVAGIDHYTRSGKPLPVAYQTTPQRMAQALAERFRTEEDIPLRFLNGEITKEELQSFGKLTSMRVFSSSTTVNEGLPRVKNWFKKHSHEKN